MCFNKPGNDEERRDQILHAMLMVRDKGWRFGNMAGSAIGNPYKEEPLLIQTELDYGVLRSRLRSESFLTEMRRHPEVSAGWLTPNVWKFFGDSMGVHIIRRVSRGSGLVDEHYQRISRNMTNIRFILAATFGLWI